MSYYPSEHLTKVVFAFNRMPETKEKKQISQKYLCDEMSLFEFAKEAENYIKQQEIL